MEFYIRKAKLSDIDSIRQLFFETITTVNTAHYSPAQIKVWSSGAEDVDRWKRKLENQEFFIAEYADEFLGFVSLLNNNYIDHLYSNGKYQGKGIASRLLNYIEQLAKGRGVTTLKSDVSITARPFFEKKGYRVIKENQIHHKGEVLINFDVEKSL